MISCIVGLKMGLLLFVLPYTCFFFFLSRFFVKDISTTVWDRNFKFVIQVHNDKLYRGNENGPSPICSSLYLFFFLSLQIFRQRYLHNRFKIETSNLVYRFITTSCIMGLKMGLLLFVLPYICFFFLSLQIFWSKISPQLFKLETSSLVWRFATTSCIVRLQMGILLYVLLFLFLSFQIFRQRYLHNRLR